MDYSLSLTGEKNRIGIHKWGAFADIVGLSNMT